MKTQLRKNYNQIQLPQGGYQQPMKYIMPIRTVVSMDTHEANLEYKGRSGCFGVIMDCTSNVTVGFSYTCYKDDTKVMSGMQMSSGISSIKSRSETKNFSCGDIFESK